MKKYYNASQIMCIDWQIKYNLRNFLYIFNRFGKYNKLINKYILESFQLNLNIC